MRTDQIAIYVDPPSHHFLGDALFASQGNVFAGDQILAPYVALRDYFAGQGIPVRTIDYLPAEIDEVRKVYVSFGMRERAAKLAARADVIASAFFAMECPVVEPSLYRALPTLQPLFRRIYSWSDTASLLPFTHAPVELEHFSWPQSFDRVHEPLWQRGERKFLMMMNSNKLPVLYTRELYTRRVAAVAYFEQFGEIDLYGKGWDGPPFRMNYGVLPGTVQKLLRRGEALWRRYVPDPQLAAARRAWQGTARHKSETLSHYTFALCFENSIPHRLDHREDVRLLLRRHHSGLLGCARNRRARAARMLHRHARLCRFRRAARVPQGPGPRAISLPTANMRATISARRPSTRSARQLSSTSSAASSRKIAA